MRNIVLTNNQQNKLGYGVGDFDIFGVPSTTPTQPKITTLPNGQVMVNSGQTTFDKVLATILAGAAIIKNRPYIPTTQHPVSENAGMSAEYYAALMAANQRNLAVDTESTGANIENFIKNNTGLLLALGGAFVLLQMRPVGRR